MNTSDEALDPEAVLAVESALRRAGRGGILGASDALLVRQFALASWALSQVIEARIIRMVREHSGVSPALRDLYPRVFNDPQTAAAVEHAVLGEFSGDDPPGAGVPAPGRGG